MPTKAEIAKRLREHVDLPYMEPLPITCALMADAAAALEATPTLEQVFACVRRDVRPGPVCEVLMGEIAALYAPASMPVANKPKTMGEWMEGDEENLFTPVAPQTETAAVEHIEDAAIPTPTDPVAAVEWTAEGLADIAAQRSNLDDDRIHEALWGIIFEERERVNAWRVRCEAHRQNAEGLTAQLAAAVAELQEERDDREKYAGVYAEMNVALGNGLAAAQQRAEAAEAKLRTVGSLVKCLAEASTWDTATHYIHNLRLILAAPPAAAPDVPRPHQRARESAGS